MRIDLRDINRSRLGRITLDPASRPTRVTIAPRDLPPREVFLNWDAAIDDAGQLRACVACGCRDLFREKSFPWVTAVIVLLAFFGAAVGLLGFADTLLKQLGLVILLLVDIALLLFSRSRLVCYRCRTSFRDLAIARYHRPWDRAVSDRYANTPAERSVSSEARPLNADDAQNSVIAGKSPSQPSTSKTRGTMGRLFRGPTTPPSPSPPHNQP